MNNHVQRLVAVAVLCMPCAGFAEIETLDLERSCGQCHGVGSHKALPDEGWLARMHELGPIETLKPDQRTEIVGFLRYHGWEVNQIVGMAGDRHLFEDKCGLCHAVQRVFVKAMSHEQLDATIERMRQRDPQWISQAEAERIAAFLKSGARGVQRPEHRIVPDEPAALFRERCAGCHPLERAYLYLETELEPHWPLLVRRMQVKAPEWISEEEAEKIVVYLSGLKPQLRGPLDKASAR